MINKFHKNLKFLNQLK